MMKKIIYTFLIFLFFIACNNNYDNSETDWFNESFFVLDDSGEFVPKVKDNGCLKLYPKTDKFYIKTDKKNYTVSLDEDKKEVFLDNHKIKIIKQKPFLCITYDDCPSSDWDAYENIHKHYTPVVPAELGLNLNRRALSYEHMKEMIADGFEIVNHGTTHHRLERVSLQKSVNTGDDKIYGWFVHTFLDGAEMQIGDEIYTIISHGTNENGNYFQVTPKFSKDYFIGTSIQLSNTCLEKELFEGIEQVEEILGTKIKQFTYPYTVSDSRTRKIICDSKKYYSCRAYNGYCSDGKTRNINDPGLNYFPFNNKFTLNSASYDLYYTEDEIRTIFEKAKRTKAMIIQFNHSWDKNFKTEKMKFLIDIAHEMGIEITTRTPIWEYYEINE